MEKCVKVKNAIWNLIPKTKFLNVQGYVLSAEGDEIVSKIADQQNDETELLIELTVKKSKEENDNNRTREIPFSFTHMTMGIEKWERVKVCFKNENDIAYISRIEEVKMNAKKIHLSCNKFKIEFTRYDDGEMKLIFKDPSGKEIGRFIGRRIFREVTEMGLLLTVDFTPDPDSSRKTVSVLIPQTDITDTADSIPINTFTVTTTVPKAVGVPSPPPPTGQIQEYKVQFWEGNAW